MDSLQIDGYKLEALMPLIRECLQSGRSVILPPRGTSMLPLIRQGIDSVRLSPIPGKLKKYDIPLYQRKNGQYVLHRIVDVGDTYTCIGDNQFALETGVCQEQLIAVVTYVYRGEQKISVDSFSYKAYCRFWHYSRRVRRFYLDYKGKLRRLIK